MSLGEQIQKIFKRIFNNRVVYDDGTYIEYFHREALIYVEGDRNLEVMWYFDSGISNKKRIMSIKENFQHWDSPHENDVIDSDKRDDIINKIKIYCEKKKIPITIVNEITK